MIKKLACFFAAFLFAIIPIFADETETQEPNITSTAYVLYNPDNAEIVEGNNVDQMMYPASLTKMLTALTVLELCEDVTTEKVTVSSEAISLLSGTNSSKAGLKANEVFTAEQLLYLMLLPSGNDAANVLAEHFSTESKSFVDAMNQKAKSIGMKNSHFANPHGLHDDDHYSTAADLAVLATAFLDQPLLKTIAECEDYKLPVTEEHAEYWVRTTNFMLVEGSGYHYQYATGLKTGYTDKAGRCLAASAEKDGKRFICILLFTPEVWGKNGLIRTEFNEAAAIFDYAFENYECVKVASKGQKITNFPVVETRNKNVDLVLKNDIYATLKKGTDLENIKINFAPKNLLDGAVVPSPVKKGQNFGSAVISIEGRELGVCQVVASSTVEANKLIVFWHKIDLYVYILVGIIAFFVLVLIFFIIRKQVVLCRRRKAREARIARRKQLMSEFSEREPYNYFKMD